MYIYMCHVLYPLYTAPNDYTPGGYSLFFSGSQKSAILSVDTVAYPIAECDKSFQAKITNSSRPEKVNIVDPDTCDVVIEDSDGEIKFGCILYGCN